MYPLAYVDALEKSGLEHIGKKGRPAAPRVLGGAAIAWGSSWDVVDHGHHHFYEGEAGVSFTRYISWALLRKGKDRILVTDRQYPARSWNPDGSSAPREDMSRSEQKMRQRMWKDANKVDRKFIRNLVRSHGNIPSVHLGDMNRGGGKKIFGTWFRNRLSIKQIKYFSNGLDYIALVDGDLQKWSVDRTGKLKINSDHATFFVVADLIP